MKSVAASLYNFLDKKQNGRVTFLELVLKLYPDLTKTHLKMVESWSE
jgi:Ca2+-binding EF-hand superfamily protein